MFLSFLIGPIVGGVIGGITNRLAIKMLFRPYNAVHCFGFQLPFTPGLIPKRKGDIAASIGEVVSNNLLDSDTLSKTLLSDEIIAKLDSSIDKLVGNLITNDDQLQSLLLKYVQSDKLHNIQSQIQSDIAQSITSKISDPTLGPKLAEMAMAHVQESYADNFLVRVATSGLMDGWLQKIKVQLGDTINNMLEENAPKLVDEMVAAEIQKLLNKPVRQLCQGHEQQLYDLKDYLLRSYRSVIETKLPNILQSLDLKKTIQDKINEMDMAETEQLILEVADKELKALVWLGVFLGFIMGFLTNIM